MRTARQRTPPKVTQYSNMRSCSLLIDAITPLLLTALAVSAARQLLVFHSALPSDIQRFTVEGMRAMAVTLPLRSVRASRHVIPLAGCIRHLSSTSTAAMHTAAAQSPVTSPAPTKSTPLIQPFQSSHLDTPTWSTRSYLPSASSPAPQLPAGLVQRLASLAYLQLSADSLPQLERDIAAMIGHISYIRHTHSTHPPIHSPLQLMAAAEQDQQAEYEGGDERVGVLSSTSADVVSDGGNAELMLRNARYTNRGFYVVPKVVDLDV